MRPVELMRWAFHLGADLANPGGGASSILLCAAHGLELVRCGHRGLGPAARTWTSAGGQVWSWVQSAVEGSKQTDRMRL